VSVGSSSPNSGWQADSVTIAEVLTALERIRHQFAQQEAGEENQPHPRNYVVTLVAVAADALGEQRAQHAAQAIASQHPSLAIVVRDQPYIREGRISASIATQVRRTEGANPVQCELVTLHVHGAAGSHLAALVDPLLVSGVPTYLWWLGTPPFGTSELNDALPICDALVVDSSGFERPYHSFLALSDMALKSHQRLGLADFQWQRLAPWRESIAQFFAPRDRQAFMKGIGEIGIDYAGEGRGNRIAAALVVGWFASALGWRLERAVGGTGGVVAALFTADHGRPVGVAFRSVPKVNLTAGTISAVRIAGVSGGRSFRLSIQRDPERLRPVGTEVGVPAEFEHLHATGGEDDAGMEIAQRRAAKHREVVVQNREALHHTATGDPPQESLPPYPTVWVRERRRADTSAVLLTMIDIGEGSTLRHVQSVPDDDEAAVLINVLATGGRDSVYMRSLTAAASLMKAL
jgi:glucose-6-phosphate dehydrogenase assembly protein OpcA